MIPDESPDALEEAAKRCFLDEKRQDAFGSWLESPVDPESFVGALRDEWP